MFSKVNAAEWFVQCMTTLRVSHRNGSTTPPVTKKGKIKPVGNLNGSLTRNTWPYNCTGVRNALYWLKGQCIWVRGLRRDDTTSITLKWLNNTQCGKMTKNQTSGQLEWLLRSNHYDHTTIQLCKCSLCFILSQSSMQLSGWYKAWLLYKNHTVMAP